MLNVANVLQWVELKHVRLAVTVAVFGMAVAAHGQSVLPPVPDSLATIFSTYSPAPVEGVWQIVDGAMVCIRRGADGFDIICVDSPDLRLTPGTVLGRVNRSDAVGGKYTASICTDVDDNGRPCKRHMFVLTLANDTPGVMTLEPTKRLHLDFWLLYRLLFTVSVHKVDKPTGLRAVRLCPGRALTPDFPVVL